MLRMVKGGKSELTVFDKHVGVRLGSPDRRTCVIARVGAPGVVDDELAVRPRRPGLGLDRDPRVGSSVLDQLLVVAPEDVLRRFQRLCTGGGDKMNALDYESCQCVFMVVYYDLP